MNSDELRETLMALEIALLTPEVRASAERLDELLADDFIEFGSSGRIFDKASVIALLTSEDTGESGTVSDFRLLTGGEDTALVTYTCEVRDADGKLRRTSLRSSAWRRQNGRWQMFFHQGTRTT